MTPENRRRNVATELGKGRRALTEAETLLRADLLEGAVSRACYATFHPVRAVLLSDGLEARSHAGVHDLLFVELVQRGRLPRSVHRCVADLQRRREAADYAAAPVTRAAADEDVAHARKACGAMEAWLLAEDW